MRIGVFAPLSYGVHERVTLSTHPILDLLLTPNISARIKIIDSRLTVSAAAAFTQSFFGDPDTPAEGQTRIFGIASFIATERVILTTTWGIAQELTEETQTTEGSLSAHYRLDQKNIVMVQGGVSKSLDVRKPLKPRGAIVYALSLDAFKAGAGVAFDHLPDSLGSVPVPNSDLEIVPYVDMWWSF